MAIIRDGEIYLAEAHVDAVKAAPRYVRERYLAVVQATQRIVRFTRAATARHLGCSVRTVQRLLKRFREKGVAGLYKESTRPRTSPRRTPPDVAARVVRVREATGLGQEDVAALAGGVSGRTVHRILVREGALPGTPRAPTKWRRFEWKRPNDLIQVDITFYQGVPILTAEDDHSRHAWACVLGDEDAETTYWAMKHLLPTEFENMLSDNGPQFAKNQPLMREFARAHVRRKHIHARAYHPQTMGKVGAYQKALKRFLRHAAGDDHAALPRWIDVFNDWWNGARHHRGIDGVPDARYRGRADPHAANARFLAHFKIDPAPRPLQAGTAT